MFGLVFAHFRVLLQQCPVAKRLCTANVHPIGSTAVVLKIMIYKLRLREIFTFDDTEAIPLVDATVCPAVSSNTYQATIKLFIVGEIDSSEETTQGDQLTMAQVR